MNNYKVQAVGGLIAVGALGAGALYHHKALSMPVKGLYLVSLAYLGWQGIKNAQFAFATATRDSTVS